MAFQGDSIGCTCNNTDHNADEALDICIAEGNAIDQNTTTDKADMAKSVWESFRPPTQLNQVKPTVTARQLDITRAVLNSTVPASENNGNKPKKQLRIAEEKNSSKCYCE